jgi:hypothetical protein
VVCPYGSGDVEPEKRKGWQSFNGRLMSWDSQSLCRLPRPKPARLRRWDAGRESAGALQSVTCSSVCIVCIRMAPGSYRLAAIVANKNLIVVKIRPTS